MSRLLRPLMGVTLPLGIGLVVLPWVMLLVAQPFRMRLALTGLFVGAAGERIWAMFFRRKGRSPNRAKGDWTALAIAIAYVVVMYGAISELLFVRAEPPPTALLVAGIGLYGVAVAFRYWSFGHLGGQWAIHVDQSEGPRELVTTGPYHLVRHPLYLAACVEVLSIPLMLGAYWSLAVALLVFVPVEVARARFEEAFLRETFGTQYAKYETTTRGFIPLPRFVRAGEAPGPRRPVLCCRKKR